MSKKAYAIIVIVITIMIGILMALFFSTKSDFVLEDRVEDTIADVREILELPEDSVHVVIRYVDDPLSTGETTTYAWVIGDPENHQYVINITNRVTRYNVAEIVAHEMVHIKQYEEGLLRFVHDRPHVVIYRSKEYNLYFVPYRLRPWEVEAFTTSRIIEYKLKQ